MEANDKALQIAPGAFDRGNRHICAFFNGMDEHYRVLEAFIKDGFGNGEKAFHLVDPQRREDHLRRLAGAGIDVDAATESGQLEVRLWQETYIPEDRFDQQAMLARIEELLAAGEAAGYQRTRLLAHMEWALLDTPGADDLIPYEARLNQVLANHDSAVVCSYDLSRFDASTVVYALRTHPLVIIGGLLQENPFYVDPDELLLELRAERPAAGAH